MQAVDLQALPDDIPALKHLIGSLHDDYLQIEKRAAEFEKLVEILKEQAEYFKRQAYGRKADDWSRDDELQSRLFDEAEAAAGEQQEEQKVESSRVQVAPHERRKRGRRPIPDWIPRVEVVHDISEAEKVCGCGAPLVRIGEDSHTVMDIIPAQIQAIRHVRPKYACRVCEGADSEGPAVKIAPPPPAMIPKSIASEGLLAHVLSSKFCDALPFYRQQRMFERLKVDIPRATMCHWALGVARRCEGLLEQLRQQIRGSDYVRIDETPVQVLQEPGRAATTKSSMWVFVGGQPEATMIEFRYHPTRSGSVPLQYLGEEFQGRVQTDGYIGYEELGRQPGIEHLGCWAHSRRKYVDVTKASSKAESAFEALKYIGKLYAVEHKADRQGLDAAGRAALRHSEAKPVLEDFHGWLEKRIQQVPPSVLLGKAIDYTWKQWPRLLVYLSDGRLSPDNNVAENAIRPFVIGRRNWLFSHNPAGAAASAALYSLISTARANKIEPYRYLRALFQQLPRAGPDPEPETLRRLLPPFIRLD